MFRQDDLCFIIILVLGRAAFSENLKNHFRTCLLKNKQFF